IHSVITSGGQAPNVVPAYAQVWYFVRARGRALVDEIYAGVLDIAKGAALMSGTTYDIDFVTGCYEMLPNRVISDLMYAKMQELGEMTFTEREIAFAAELQKTFPAGSLEYGYAMLEKTTSDNLNKSELANPLWTKVIRHAPTSPVMPGSTEVADVSQITPTV